MSVVSKFKKFFVIKKKYGYKKSMAIALNYIFKRHIFVIDQPAGAEYEDLRLFNNSNRYKKTVLFFSNELMPTGAPIALMSMIKAFIKLGYKPFVISFRTGDLLKELKENNIPAIVSEAALYNPAIIFSKITRKFDIIFANTIAWGKLIDYCEKESLPTMWWIHEGKTRINLTNSFLPSTKHFKYTKIFAVSDIVKQDLKSYFPDAKTKILPLAYNFNVTPSLSKRRNDLINMLIYVNDPYIKGLDILEKSLSKIKLNSNKKIIINVISDDEKLKTFNNNVYFVLKGRMGHDEMIEEMQNNDLILIPSREETFSILALEAIKLKRPFIASDNIGIKSFLPKYAYNDFFFKNGDSNDLALKINTFVNEQTKYINLSKKIFNDCGDMFSESSLKRNLKNILINDFNIK